MSEKTKDLQNCPFCGSKARHSRTVSSDDPNQPWWYVCCTSSKCAIETGLDKKDVVLRLWNTRTPDLADEVSRLKTELEKQKQQHDADLTAMGKKARSLESDREYNAELVDERDVELARLNDQFLNVQQEFIELGLSKERLAKDLQETIRNLQLEVSRLKAELARRDEEVEEYRFAAEGMVAAFDDRPTGEPADITQTTREAALNVAKQILGWSSPVEAFEALGESE